ncbi:hypothetical protein N4P33_25145 [Streptomyces sp. 15-116A]|uniref:DUF4190 domain-containing protein n=1 Tax=Streptomyces sp. 15-116A TaxID=2259035 RepID=UPI0021B3319D|nr:hypothetical protein [Streptomyces sp. 15-116A]MCT7355419.1 hypothetical protein [Streptomyces sp. 15-116A]
MPETPQTPVTFGKPTAPGTPGASTGASSASADHATPDPWAPPTNSASATGPRAAGDSGSSDGYPGPGQTIADNTPQPWSSPTGPAAPSVHDQQTLTSFPAMGGPASPPPPSQPWAGPQPQTPAPNPFAPPPSTGSVPPPPIAPDGPGQVPYGYPGGYVGAPGPGQAYYGWSMTPMPSNGLGVAGLVLGIISAAGFCLWPLAIVLGVLGVIFGSVGRAKVTRGEATNPGQALAGIICGAVGLVLGIGFGVLLLTT